LYTEWTTLVESGEAVATDYYTNNHLVYLVPISTILDKFDSVDNGEESLDDEEPLTMREVLDDLEIDDDLLASIKSVGFTEPLPASHTCRLWDGHHRLATARLIGYNSVPIIFGAYPDPSSTTIHKE